jgi:peptidoglycan L-alanyl-D-glutamate endopeptidase CwlK
MTCEQPFVVFEGIRTVERERSLIAKGFSKLKNPFRCRHVPTRDPKHGLVSHAVDLVPLVGGQPKWLWPQIYPIARAMKAAAAIAPMMAVSMRLKRARARPRDRRQR